MNRNSIPIIAGSAAIVVLTMLTTSAAYADGYFDPTTGIFTEKPGDAGQLLPNAEIATMGGVVEITGELDKVGAKADLYEIDITNPSSFSAMILTADTKVSEPQLFLFTSSDEGIAGEGVAMAYTTLSGSASLTASSLASAGVTLTAGKYYLGIGAYNYQPVDNTNHNKANYLFPSGAPGATVKAQNSDILADWDLGDPNTGDDTGGKYNVHLSGLAAPEPGMVVTGLSMLSMTGFGVIKGRLRKRAA